MCLLLAPSSVEVARLMPTSRSRSTVSIDWVPRSRQRNADATDHGVADSESEPSDHSDAPDARSIRNAARFAISPRFSLALPVMLPALVSSRRVVLTGALSSAQPSIPLWSCAARSGSDLGLELNSALSKSTEHSQTIPR